MLAIGIDIGGTKILGAVIDEDANIVKTVEKATLVSKGKDYVIESIINIISELIALYSIDVIGIGSAGRVDVDKGEIYFATPNLPNWTGFKIKDRIQEYFNIPTIVDNDVNVAGIGEFWMGASKDYQSSVCLTLGTGVAAAVYINGQLIRGSHWSTGEIGHMILHPHGKKCNCGQSGCLEQYCCGTALVKNYNEQTEKELVSSGEEFFCLVYEKDPVAQTVLDKFIDDLAIAMVSLSNIYDPEVFIIGGGLIDTKDYWWNQMCLSIKKYANAAVSNPVILPARFKNHAGVIGAAKLGFDFITVKESEGN